MTNREYINSMTDEELADFLYWQPWTEATEYYTLPNRFMEQDEALVVWLKEEHKE